MSHKRSTDRQGGSGVNKRSRGEDDTLRESTPVPGSILKVELQNFMCHTFFEVEFSSTVNFIVGRNGSGKSAILMALVIGLGGKSSATHRAPNMTEFIKQGSSWGQVTITICNSNRNRIDAWEYETYGDKVAVERRITKNGSSYKLKNAAGKTISTKKNDLTLLLDHYNIQVNNPVSILNQEMAKKFLASTDPQSKYSFFMKSTHLEQMILDYQHVNEKLETIKHTVAKKERSVPDIKAQVKHLQNQYNEITELRDMGRKVSVLKDELIWSKVKEIEEELVPIERSIDKLRSHLPKFEAEISKATEKYNEAEKDVKTIETEMSEDMKRYASLESDQASLKQLALAKKREVIDLQRKAKHIRDKTKDIDGDRARLAERIKEIEASNKARNIEAEREAREAELAKCKSLHEQYTSEMTTTTATMEDLDRKIGSLNEEFSRIREDIESHEFQLKKEESMLKNYQQAKKNRVSVFGDFMPELLRRIDDVDRQGRFHRRPRGPFGLHIKVRDAKWAKVIELALGALIFNFVVHDQHDKNVLQELFRSTITSRSYPNMVMMKFKDTAYDVSGQKPRTGHPTMYDMVEIDDHVISNALVEQARIEQSLLIEESEEARKLIIGHAPRHVFNAWTLTGDDVRERASYSNNPDRYNKGYFRDDPSQVIEEINVKIRGHREQIVSRRGNAQRIDQEVKKLRKEYNGEKVKQQGIKQKLEGIRGRMIDLDNLEEAPLQTTMVLEEEMQGYAAQVADLKTELESIVGKEAQMKEEQQDAIRRLNESIERDSHIANRLEELKSKLHEGQKLITTRHATLDKFRKKKKEVNAEIKKFNQDCTAKKREIQDARGMAEQRCARVDTRRSAKDLEQQIRNMELRIQQGASSTASVDDITRRFHEAKTKYEEIQGMVSQMKKFSRELQQILEEREVKYHLFQKEISKRINYFFIMNLSQRGYTGKLEVDHDKRQLLMHLNVDTSGASHDTHDVRSLSGGERSFSTVCFICSLWNLMESPFRCLDEFDVFMDLYNRRITMNLLMEHAFQNQTPRQYIFFTPQDMSATSKKHKNIKILQLAPPERNNEDE